VYATCSIEPEENQRQVDNFLERHPEFVLDKPFGLIKGTYIDNSGFLYITPFEHKMDGMFAARMRRI
jgi:16S rRNA (cytosine967-C5)-methyltransferase